MASVTQPSFTTGELAPSLHGRVDLARYYTALKTCRNWIVRPFGGVCNRPGTKFIAEVKDSADITRLIPFEFSSAQSYVLEFGDYVIRIIKDGGLVLWPSGPSVGLPVEVVTIWPSSALSHLAFSQSNDVMTLTHPSYPSQQLSRTDHHLWSLAAFDNVGGPFQEINITTANTISTNGVTGNVTITAVNAIFTADMVGQLFYVEQSPDAQIKRWEVAAAVTVNDKKRAGANYYQAITSGTTGTVRPDHLEGVAYDGDPGISWQFLHSGFGIILLTGFTTDKIMTGTVQPGYRLPDQIMTATSIKAITGAVAVDPDSTPGTGDEYVTVTCAAHGFVTGESVTIASVGGMTDLNAAFQITVIDANTFRVTLETVQVYTSGGTATRTLTAVPTYKWALEAWGGNQGYPATSIYYQQRQVFGGTLAGPQNNWMSRSGGYTDFGASNPLLDDDSISFKLVAEKMHEIRHFIRMKNLIALTSEGAWLIQKDQGNPIPLTDPQEQGGASYVRPLRIGKNAIYIEERGGAIRSLGFEFNSDSYEGHDLTLTGSHLVFGKEVVDWAFQKVPFRCVWAVLDDGSMLGLTYLPDQEIVGWHRHDTDGLIESVCSIPEGKEDAVYLVVKRTINGVSKRYIERLASRYPVLSEDYFFVDCGLTYDGRLVGAGKAFTLSGGTEWTYQETLTFTTAVDFFTGVSDIGDAIGLIDSTGELLRLTITGYTSAKIVTVMANRTVPVEFRGAGVGFQMARNTFAGLDHLEGKTVAILADGNDEPQAVVTGGVVTLAYPATVVHVGLPITADLETLDINVQGQSLQDRVKNIRSVTLLVEQTRGLQAGPDADNLLELSPLRSGSYFTPVGEDTGIVKANIISDWSDGGRVMFRQDKPLPATLLAAIPELQVGGS